MRLGGCSMKVKLADVAVFIMWNFEVICYLKCIADTVKLQTCPSAVLQMNCVSSVVYFVASCMHCLI